MRLYTSQQPRAEKCSPQHVETLIAGLYQCDASRLFAYLSRHLSSLPDAEDLLLDVFLAALEHEDKLKVMREDERRAWLWTVARNKLVNHYKKSQHQQHIPLEAIASAMDPERTPEQSMLDHEEDEQLWRFLRKLSPLQKEVLELRFVGGLRCTEIATVLHKREGAIRTMLSRAIRVLREMYRH